MKQFLYVFLVEGTSKISTSERPFLSKIENEIKRNEEFVYVGIFKYYLQLFVDLLTRLPVRFLAKNW